jgi:hypothetical protein
MGRKRKAAQDILVRGRIREEAMAMADLLGALQDRAAIAEAGIAEPGRGRVKTPDLVFSPGVRGD